MIIEMNFDYLNEMIKSIKITVPMKFIKIEKNLNI